MSRLDWKRGRFTSDKYETQEFNRALRGYQSTQVYDALKYFRFERSLSEMNDIFDEGEGAGRVYRPAVVVPVLHVNHTEGRNQDLATGFYVNDDIYVTASFDQLYRTGLSFQDIEHEIYLKDRFIYDRKLWRITAIHILGQVMRGRDIIISIEGTQVKASEIVNDPQFAEIEYDQPIEDD